MLADILSWLLLLAGGFFAIVGGVGVLRMPDFFTRLHAAGITDTLGAMLILTGLMIQGGWTLITVKLILIFLFLMFTSPTASHALAKAALSDNVKPFLSADSFQPEKVEEQEGSSSKH